MELAFPSGPEKIRYIEAEVIVKPREISKKRDLLDEVMGIISQDESVDMFKKLPLCWTG
jgi:hypothetical protein